MTAMASGPVVGIDIGGTSVKLGVVGTDGTILARESLGFRQYANFDALADALTVAVAALAQACGQPIAAIGVASPGIPDPDTGVLEGGAYNVPILRGHSMLHGLQSRGLPARAAINDAVAAALGEHAYGSAKGLDRFALITLGTGVGGCVMIGGMPVTGYRGHPPEIGAMVLDPAGPLGLNGLCGTLEGYAAVSGFIAAHVDAGGPPDATPEAIFTAAEQGDAVAFQAVDATCRRIAQAFGAMINMLALDACVIGGGLSQAGAILVERVRAHLPEFTWPALLATADTRLASTGNDAGLLGAAVAAAASQTA